MTGLPPKWVWVAATVVACLCVNPYVRGDGNGYYAWLVSPIVDGDLDFTNQFRRGDPLFQTLIFEEDGSVRADARTPTGRVGNQWSVGPAVAWAPWFLVAHAGVTAARLGGADIEADGYSWPYVWLVAVGTVVYGALALWWSAGVAVRLGFGSGVAIGVLGIALASSLPVYQVFLPLHVHALAASAVAAFVAYHVRHSGMATTRSWAVWGLIAGLMVQVYQLNGVLLLVAAWVWGSTVRRDGWARAVWHGVVFTLAGLLASLPQLVGKAIVYGHPLTSGYQDQFFWSEPRLWDTAFSSDHGWILWTPVVGLALAGLVTVWRRGALVRPLLVASAVFYVVVASYQNWHGQSSFGNRFFVSLTVVLVVGLSALASRLPATRRRGLGVLVGVLIVWNAGFAFQWGTNIIPNRGPVAFRDVALNQVTVVPGRLVEFARRYLVDRRGAQDDVEGPDQIERRDYKVVR